MCIFYSLVDDFWRFFDAPSSMFRWFVHYRYGGSIQLVFSGIGNVNAVRDAFEEMRNALDPVKPETESRSIMDKTVGYHGYHGCRSECMTNTGSDQIEVKQYPESTVSLFYPFMTS